MFNAFPDSESNSDPHKEYGGVDEERVRGPAVLMVPSDQKRSSVVIPALPKDVSVTVVLML